TVSTMEATEPVSNAKTISARSVYRRFPGPLCASPARSMSTAISTAIPPTRFLWPPEYRNRPSTLWSVILFSCLAFISNRPRHVEGNLRAGRRLAPDSQARSDAAGVLPHSWKSASGGGAPTHRFLLESTAVITHYEPKVATVVELHFHVPGFGMTKRVG